MTDEEVQQQHPLVALLRSLLPWVDMGQQPDYDDDAAGGREGAEEAEGAAGGGQLPPPDGDVH